MKQTILRPKNKKDWFRLKKYPHIGELLSPKDRNWIETYVKNSDKIAVHAFLPFIHRKLESRKFRREICHDGTRSVLRKPAVKDREIYYATHIDSNIYSYYAEQIGKEYEKALEMRGIQNCITAYRTIKHDSKRNKCNIDFANEIFTFVKDNCGNNLTVITFDIKGFFDNLNHRILKHFWKIVVGSGSSLPDDHYNLFRNITKFSYIEEHDIFREFKNEIIVERNPDIKRKIEVKKIYHLKNKRAIAYCKRKAVDLDRLRSQKLIKSNKYFFDPEKKLNLGLRNKGIPQGSPISSVLANVYLLNFDEHANKLLNRLGGMYRRYSDDMIAICPPGDEEYVIKFFQKAIRKYCLEIQQQKTQVFQFNYNHEQKRHFCFEKNLNTGKLMNNTKFEYLGFQFDGNRTLIKNAGLSNYYRKMKRTIRRSWYYTVHNRTKTKGELFKARLYKRLTHLGGNRRRKYARHPSKSNVFYLTRKQDWGNYHSYVKLADNIMPGNGISKQLKKHWRIFHRLINENPY